MGSKSILIRAHSFFFPQKIEASNHEPNEMSANGKLWHFRYLGGSRGLFQFDFWSHKRLDVDFFFFFPLEV